MLRNDEELRGPNRRTRAHIEENEHLEWGVCVTVPSSCLNEYQKPQGVSLRWTK